MRAIGAASAALLGAAALALTAPTAAAVDSFVITPSTVAPGGRVTLSAPGCSGTAMASSGVFDTVTIPAGGSAVATVDWDARRGAVYTVSFTCAGGAPGTAQLTIARAPTTSSTAVPTVTRTATVIATPSGVRGGLGGSVGGWNAGELVAGTALVVAAATGVVYVMRRRAENRRH
ncbi:hypothetical protein [Streptomyces sp. TRM64462]|uniref:hypothetical protein n=1 Tax=Streptomyces sp. TRM64462 TaxID=2741726 RepID=UPI001585EA11|nr:hypothetical protein [Streptomyces sp. TRM64462]